MNNLRIIIAALCFLALLPVNCTSSTQKLSKTSEAGLFNAELLYTEEFKYGRNDVVLKLTNNHGEAVTGAEIEITPWMPDMGHGVMWVPKVTDKGGGYYDVIIMLSMGGFWELRTEISFKDQQDQVVFGFNAKEGEKKKP